MTYGPEALANLVLGLDGKGVGLGKGAGDCDCVTAGTGALFESVGFPTRLAITAPPNISPGPMFSHVFLQVNIPGRGWITADPVVHPLHGFGYTPKHSRIAVYDLDGQLLRHEGNVVGLSGDTEKGAYQMYGQMPDLTQWPDQGMGGYDEEDSNEPEDWRLYGFNQYGKERRPYGAFSEKMGIIDCAGLGGIACEVTPQLIGGQVVARTPLLELEPQDFQYVQTMWKPKPGMRALGDDGAIYEFDGTLGFFKRLFRGIKKVARKIRKGVRKVIKKIPGGKYLIKLGKKIWKISKKFVKPLVKFVGKYAAKLAPVAALIPGFGPAVAAGLYTAGKVANMMRKVGATVKAVKGGKLSKLVFPSGSKAKMFQKLLTKAAKKEKRRQRRGGKVKRARASGRRAQTARRRGQTIARRARRRAAAGYRPRGRSYGWR